MYYGPARGPRAESLGIASIGQRKDISSLVNILRLHIGRIEHSQPKFAELPIQPWFLGVPAIDGHLSLHGLTRTGLHDVTPQAYGDTPAAMGFALALTLRCLASERRPLLWCRLAREEREYGKLYGHGLETLGLVRNRFLTVTLKKPAALLWTMEEALKSGALALVIGDADPKHASLTVTRRLSLAAHAGKSAGLLIFSKPCGAATASHTRWMTSARKSRAPPYDLQAPGNPAWDVELIRARGGRPGAWSVEWHNATHRFDLVPGIQPGGLHPWTDEGWQIPTAGRHALRAG